MTSTNRGKGSCMLPGRSMQVTVAQVPLRELGVKKPRVRHFGYISSGNCISSKTSHCSYWCYVVLYGDKNWLFPKMCYFNRRTHVSLLFYQKNSVAYLVLLDCFSWDLCLGGYVWLMIYSRPMITSTVLYACAWHGWERASDTLTFTISGQRDSEKSLHVVNSQDLL